MQQEIPSQKYANQGFLIAVVSAVVLSFTSILIRMVSEDYQVPALVLAFWRNFFLILCALPFLYFFKRKLLIIKPGDLPFLVYFGIVLSIFNILWTLSVTLTGASVATVLVYSSGAFTAVLGFFILKEGLGLQKIIAVMLCLAGCVFVSGAADPNAWHTNPLGILTGLFSGLLYAIYSLMGRHATQRGLNPWTTLFYTFLFAAGFLLMINLLPLNFIPATATRPIDLFHLRTQWRGWVLLLLLAAGPTLIGFGLYNVSLGILPSSVANLILTLEPVFTAITAYFLLAERLKPFEVFGGGLILLGVIVLRFRKRSTRIAIKLI
jgi:drug/metabolite transporter (DMT)-like permease